MTIAGSVEERAEVWARAALALCNLALVHEGMLLAMAAGRGESENNGDSDDGVRGSSDTPSSMLFNDTLLKILGHPKPGIVIVSAEIAAKLLLAECVRDPRPVAWLVLFHFNASLAASYRKEGDDDNDNAGNRAKVKEVGSPVRPHQLLSMFIPMDSMSNLNVNVDMMVRCGFPALDQEWEAYGGEGVGKETLAS